MATNSHTDASPTPPPADLPLVQFTTRQLLLFVAGASVICMILVSLDGYSAVVFSVGAILVAGHVASTAIGSRLRATADATRLWEVRRAPPGAENHRLQPVREYVPPGLSQLQVRTACSSLLWWFVGVVMVCGGVLSASGFSRIAGPNVGWPGLLIGAISAAMLLGWMALVFGGVCGIARRSWRMPHGQQMIDGSRDSRDSAYSTSLFAE